MDHYGIRGISIDWFSSYLSEKKQYVSANGHISDYLDISCGVQQGSLLGPLLDQFLTLALSTLILSVLYISLDLSDRPLHALYVSPDLSDRPLHALAPYMSALAPLKPRIRARNFISAQMSMKSKATTVKNGV